MLVHVRIFQKAISLLFTVILIVQMFRCNRFRVYLHARFSRTDWLSPTNFQLQHILIFPGKFVPREEYPSLQSFTCNRFSIYSRARVLRTEWLSRHTFSCNRFNFFFPQIRAMKRVPSLTNFPLQYSI